MSRTLDGLRPRDLCRGLLEALEAAEGRRKRRHRDTTPDSIGLALKRRLLTEAVRDDPAPEAFEAWLAGRCIAEGAGDGGLRAVALGIRDEWRLALQESSFSAWLARGAPSADRADAGAADRGGAA
jgi:hypothetical protein